MKLLSLAEKDERFMSETIPLVVAKTNTVSLPGEAGATEERFSDEQLLQRYAFISLFQVLEVKWHAHTLDI